MISARTKAALSAARRRGVKLGGFHSRAPSAKDVRASVAATRAKAEATGSPPGQSRHEPEMAVNLTRQVC